MRWFQISVQAFLSRLTKRHLKVDNSGYFKHKYSDNHADWGINIRIIGEMRGANGHYAVSTGFYHIGHDRSRGQGGRERGTERGYDMGRKGGTDTVRSLSCPKTITTMKIIFLLTRHYFRKNKK